MLAVPLALKGGVSPTRAQPGDLVASMGAINSALTTAGAGTILGAMIASGIIARTGPTAGYTDTTDTADNIIAALGGNVTGADVVPGTSFEVLYQNQVAFAMTLAAGAGVVLGNNVNVAASAVRKYLFTVLNNTPASLQNCATTNTSPTVTFQNPLKMGAVTPGQSVSGTGISAGTTVLGLITGQTGITGVTLSSNATATNTLVGLTFTPTVRIDGLWSATA